MGRAVFHASIEGAQHGPKGLEGFLDFAMEAGAAGAQPSNFMLDDGNGGLLAADSIKQVFTDKRLKLDGVSAHCPFWVHTTAWTGSRSIRPFIPGSVNGEEAEQWAEDYILRLLDLCAELGVKVVPMFWGMAFGLELATGYPWGFWAGPGYDLVKEGLERFVKKTQKLRNRARRLGIKLCHEIHPGTAAMCADDFLALVEACDGDECLAVNADPSHCWEGEDWRTRFEKVGDRVCACHVKNHHVVPGRPLRSMQPDWKLRGMQFTPLFGGDINLQRYAELMLQVGYPERYCMLMGTETAPLVSEAEAAFQDLDETAMEGIEIIDQLCCFEVAETSFEEGMGAQE